MTELDGLLGRANKFRLDVAELQKPLEKDGAVAYAVQMAKIAGPLTTNPIVAGEVSKSWKEVNENLTSKK